MIAAERGAEILSLSTLLPDTARRAPCTASALAIALPSRRRRRLSAVMPLRSNITRSPCQRFHVVDGHHAGHLRVGRDALDHSAEHLAAELDELLDARLRHVCDAFAPADHGSNLLDQLVADRVRILVGSAVTLATNGIAGGEITT